MNIALVTAAGTGSRMNCHIPKQFLTVNDKPIVLYTLEALQRNHNIDRIIVACLSGWEKVLDTYVQHYGLTKVNWIVEGGDTGQESITLCLDAIRDSVSADDLVIVHDGNRPFVEDYVINESIRVCREHGNAVAAIPCTEAILKVPKKPLAAPKSGHSVDRDTLVRTQTPHTFRFQDLDEAYVEIRKINKVAVAPCTVMVELGKEVHLSPGSELNFKITTQEDLRIFSALLKASGQDSP